jgi:hypothetical protein
MVEWTKKTAPLGLNVQLFATWQDALPEIKKLTHEKTITFVKASRGVGLQNIIDALPVK